MAFANGRSWASNTKCASACSTPAPQWKSRCGTSLSLAWTTWAGARSCRNAKKPKRRPVDPSVGSEKGTQVQPTGCHIFCHSLIPRFGSVSKIFFRMPARAFCFEACLSLAPKLPRRLRQPQGRYHHGAITRIFVSRLWTDYFGTDLGPAPETKWPQKHQAAHAEPIEELHVSSRPPKPGTHCVCVCVRADGQAASDIRQAQPSAMYVKPSTRRIFQPWEPEHS